MALLLLWPTGSLLLGWGAMPAGGRRGKTPKVLLRPSGPVGTPLSRMEHCGRFWGPMAAADAWRLITRRGMLPFPSLPWASHASSSGWSAANLFEPRFLGFLII